MAGDDPPVNAVTGVAQQQSPTSNEEYKMNKIEKKNDKSAWIIGGTTLIGIGVGFIFLQVSALLFVASLLIGIGVGLVITSLISSEKG